MSDAAEAGFLRVAVTLKRVEDGDPDTLAGLLRDAANSLEAHDGTGHAHGSIHATDGTLIGGWRYCPPDPPAPAAPDDAHAKALALFDEVDPAAG